MVISFLSTTERDEALKIQLSYQETTAAERSYRELNSGSGSPKPMRLLNTLNSYYFPGIGGLTSLSASWCHAGPVYVAGDLQHLHPVAHTHALSILLSQRNWDCEVGLSSWSTVPLPKANSDRCVTTCCRMQHNQKQE